MKTIKCIWSRGYVQVIKIVDDWWMPLGIHISDMFYKTFMVPICSSDTNWHIYSG